MVGAVVGADVGDSVLGTQSLFVASHNVDAPQSAAEVAHTVEAAASLGSRQQQRRSSVPDEPAQVEEAAVLASQLPAPAAAAPVPEVEYG